MRDWRLFGIICATHQSRDRVSLSILAPVDANHSSGLAEELLRELFKSRYQRR